MALRASPFPNIYIACLHNVGWALILPCFWFLDRLIAVCKSTTLENSQRLEQECYLHPLKVLCGSVVFFLLFLSAAPVALLGFLLWAPVQSCRRPFSYQRRPPTALPDAEASRVEAPALTGKKAAVGFATANLCLLPDSLARFNNLGHTQRRTAAIARRIVQGVGRPRIRIFVDSPSSHGPLSTSDSLLSSSHGGPCTYGATAGQDGAPARGFAANGGEVVSASASGSLQRGDRADVVEPPRRPLIATDQNSALQGAAHEQSLHSPLAPAGGDDVPWQVSSLFPADVDVLCLQEVFDKRAARRLAGALRPLYGHVLYDVGVYACRAACCCSAFKFLNSGLFLASRFPVLEARYHCFPNGRGEDALASKGLLSAKVLIGQNQKREKLVGYFNCTHLHAPQGEGDIRCEQLNMVTKWIDEFQAANKQPAEVVVFDVLCGDFNFDNCSPDDSLEQNHHLFADYKDPCRAGPGKEKPWVIGTLLEQPTLYEDEVSCPDNLQRTLECQELRKRFISPPVPVSGCPLVYPELGQPWVGRRIDYVLYRESTISKHCRTDIEELTYVTQLAGLTDHIPVGLRLSIIMDTDNADEQG